VAQTLLSPRLKLERANEHLKAFHAEINAYIERRPQHLSTELDADGWNVVSVEIVRPMPEVVPLILGDAIHCLRSALDHIVYAVGSGRNRGRGYYPICIEEADYLKPRGNPPFERPPMRDEGLASVPEHIRTIIDRTQPYHGGARAKEHVLSVITSLDNADKHRLVQPALTVINDPGTVTRVTNSPMRDPDTLTTEWLGIGTPLRTDGKTQVLRWRTEPPSEKHVNVQYNPRVGVAIGERGDLAHIDLALNVIYKLIDEIEAAIL
jgi:hypothetical protein